MFALVAALVAFLGLAVALGTLVAALRLGADARRERLRQRVDLGHAPSSARGRASAWLVDPSTLLAHPAGRVDLPTFDLLELVGAAAGLGVGLLVLGWPTGLFGLAFGLVPAVVRWRRNARVEDQLVRQLPGALEVMVSAMRAGHAFSEALRLAAGETQVPLRAELMRVVDEHRLGISLRDALAAVVERHPRSQELRLFVSAVLFQQEAGGNLVDLLEQLAGAVQDRITFEDKARAITAEVRLSTNVLAGLPVFSALAVLAIVPDHFDPLLATPIGRGLLAVCVVGLVGGFAVVHGLVRTLRP